MLRHVGLARYTARRRKSCDGLTHLCGKRQLRRCFRGGGALGVRGGGRQEGSSGAYNTQGEGGRGAGRVGNDLGRGPTTSGKQHGPTFTRGEGGGGAQAGGGARRSSGQRRARGARDPRAGGRAARTNRGARHRAYSEAKGAARAGGAQRGAGGSLIRRRKRRRGVCGSHH